MVTALVTCWIVTHTSADAKDYRNTRQFVGYVMKEYNDKLLVNFYDSFQIEHIDLKFNSVTQLISDNDCSYGK
jgi:hypothetical protein